MRILLIWDNKGELGLYNIPANDQEEKMLLELNGVFMADSVDRGSKDPRVQSYLKVRSAVSSEFDAKDPFINWQHKWRNHKVALPLWVAGQVDWVVHCGVSK